MPGPECAPEALSAHHHRQNTLVGKSRETWIFVMSPPRMTQARLAKSIPSPRGIFVSPARDAGVTLLAPEPKCQCWNQAALLGCCCCGRGERQAWLPLIKMCPNYSCTTASSWTRIWPLTISPSAPEGISLPSPWLTDSSHQFFPSFST